MLHRFLYDHGWQNCANSEEPLEYAVYLDSCDYVIQIAIPYRARMTQSPLTDRFETGKFKYASRALIHNEAGQVKSYPSWVSGVACHVEYESIPLVGNGKIKTAWPLAIPFQYHGLYFAMLLAMGWSETIVLIYFKFQRTGLTIPH